MSAVLLRRCADRTGLTDALAGVLPSSTVAGWRDRAGVLVHLAVAILPGAANLSEAGQLQLHHRPLFGLAATDSTARRTLAALDEAALVKIARARAQVRRHVWSLLHLRPGGFPWLTGLNTREGWPEDMRLIVRHVRPTRRHLKKLTAFEKKTGWRYAVTATDIRHMWGIAGSGHSQYLDVLHRSHAGVEDRVRTSKAMGLDNLPSQSWEVNRGWMLAANLASDLDAWLRLLALHGIDGLAEAEPDAMRFRLYHLPARLADHARRRFLRIDAT